MIWLFLSVLLLLVVFHRGFRSVMGWFTGAAVLICAAAAGVIHWQHTKNPSNFDLASAVIVCPRTQQNTSDPHTCYDPHDPAQFAQHLKECKVVPGDSHPVKSAPAQDSRAVPCNYFDQYANQPTQAVPAVPPAQNQ